jgi:tetratricopeptide (TPR) repeat protein
MNFVKNVFYGKKINELLSTANQNLKNKNYNSAIDEFTKVLSIDKKNPAAFYGRGVAYFETEKFDLSKSDFLTLETLSPNFNTLTDSYLAKIHLNLNETYIASRYAEKYYSNNLDNSEAQYFLARVKYFNEEYDYALELTNGLCSRFPEDFNIRYFRSLISYANKNYLDAIVDIDKAIEITPINCFAFNLRGLINVGLRNFKEALEDFDYAIRLNPDKAIYYFNKAKIEYKIGDLIEAQKSLDKSIDLDINNEAAYILKAEINVLNENYIDALEDYQRVLLLDPDNLKLLERNVELKTFLFDYEGAKKDLAHALNLDNENSELHFRLAHLYTKLGNYVTAKEELDKVLALNPQHKEALINKGILEYYNKEFEASIKTFDMLLELEPNLQKVIMYRAKSKMKLGEYQEAKKDFKKISNVNKDVEYFVLASKAEYKLGESENAIKNISHAIEMGEIDKSAELLKNTIKFEAGLMQEMNKVDESYIENSRNIDAIILKGLFNFEKEHYEEAKEDFEKVIGLDSSKEETLKPFMDYVIRVLN